MCAIHVRILRYRIRRLQNFSRRMADHKRTCVRKKSISTPFRWLDSFSKISEQPFGKIPVLEVDGNQLSQSVAICRYLGKRFGLTTDDQFKEALLEAVVDNMRDVQISEGFSASIVSFPVWYLALSIFQSYPKSSWRRLRKLSRKPKRLSPILIQSWSRWLLMASFMALRCLPMQRIKYIFRFECAAVKYRENR